MNDSRNTTVIIECANDEDKCSYGYKAIETQLAVIPTHGEYVSVRSKGKDWRGIVVEALTSVVSAGEIEITLTVWFREVRKTKYSETPEVFIRDETVEAE